MTIDAEKCRAILAAERRTGRRVTVTFNYRFSPYTSRIKALLREGAIGKILSVDFEWFLDTSHGADYFRRWHRRLENSGGLLVHKATHHFDIINWWIEDYPQRVYALGDRRFYGPTRAERGERCSTCAYQRTCEFYFDLAADPLNKSLYSDAEHLDGYHRDGCVFSPEIDIYDTMSVNVRYHHGAFLTYSLIAHCPYEGWRASLNGTGGRMELQEYHSGQSAAEPNYYVRLFNRNGAESTHSIPKLAGTHGGSDALLAARLFRDGDMPDPLGQSAGSLDGAMSILLGIAANQSIITGQPVEVDSLLRD
jgi:predicted dehydrogenase